MKKNKLDTHLKLIVKTSFFVFIGVILSKILTYVYRIIVARYFGVEIYGIFSLALMVLGWMVVFASFGLTEGLVRYISIYRGKNENNKIRYIFRFSLVFLVISSILAGILLFFLSETISLKIFHDDRLIIFLKIFSIVIPFSIISNIFLSILRAFEKVVWNSFIINIFQNIVKIVILIILIFVGIGANSIIFSYFFGTFLVLIASYFSCRYFILKIFKKPAIRKTEKLIIRKELLSYSWPLMFWGFFASIFYWTDSFMIGFFKTVFDVGLYNAAIPIAFLFNLVQDLFMQLFFPLITKEFSKKNFKVIRELSKQVAKWIFIINLPLFLIIIIFPEQIIKLLFGLEFIKAATALRILAIGSIFSFLVPISNTLLSMAGKSKLLLTNIIITMVINIILNALLIPKYGITGAAIATTISWIILSLMLFFETKHFAFVIPLRRKMLRILLVSAIPLILLILIKKFVNLTMPLFVLFSIFFFLFYLLIISITGCLDKNDLSIINAFKKKGQKIILLNK